MKQALPDRLHVRFGSKVDNPLVLLEASPLADINNTRKIDAVVFNGKLLPKPELQKMLDDLEAAGKKE